MQHYDDEPSRLVTAADRQVAVLLSAARWSRLRIRFLYGVAVVLAVVLVLVGAVAVRQQGETRQLNDVNIRNCETGNTYRAAERQIWDYFIGLLLKGNKDPKAQAAGKAFLAYVASIDAPRDCAMLSVVSKIPTGIDKAR